MAISIERIDHFVITVSDINTTLQFYERVLGMESTTFGDGRKALHFGNQKINIHPIGKEAKPNAANAQPGSADICFISTFSIEVIKSHLATEAVEVIYGPAKQVGALGPMDSIYFRDPDGNLIEIGVYHRGLSRPHHLRRH